MPLSIAYAYDSAGQPTKITYPNGKAIERSYDATGCLSAINDWLGNQTSFSYDADSKLLSTSFPAPTHQIDNYAYNQAQRLTEVNRAPEGQQPKVEHSYTYDGEGLLAAQSSSGPTGYLTWDRAGGLPLLLSSDGESFSYGPGGEAFEQVSSLGTVEYLHHDASGSTRLITGSSGTVEGAYSYSPYGEVIGHTGSATTALGFDWQYTNADTGLIYLRNRAYDPSTGQFMSVDPLEELTRTPYSFAGDHPLTHRDRRGLRVEPTARSSVAWSVEPNIFGGVPCKPWEGIERAQREAKELKERWGREEEEEESKGEKINGHVEIGCAIATGVSGSWAWAVKGSALPFAVTGSFCAGFEIGNTLFVPILREL